MILLKFILAIIGLATVIVAIIGFFTELTEALGFIGALVGVALVYFVLGNDKVSAFLEIPSSMIDSICFGAFIGGGIICAMDFGKLGSAMITIGWVGVGLILMQVIPIPFIAEMLEVATLPALVACVPLLIVLMFVM